ncbi:hypothetical protein [Chengkuizengella axinellae]|uniref:t-SNARE coiled-coil homology domain-containing protein n=1 Tax=Chengkuizengella axinellae TaxID=3064388 RepID=A0ABT9IX11_9BACL|nr:hypothetical protein [Chengkuizengella sp. 2205SS18-9]MDP5273647.1 hypothetical protein [Chengkuizengella sp. 2205SS18-9]
MNDNQLNRMEEMLGTLIKLVGDNNARLKTQESRTDKFDKDLHEIKYEIKEIQKDVEGVKSDIEEVKSDIEDVKSDVEEVKSDVKDIKEGQERQDRILEMLSVKSVETESYIRDFKRRL